MCNSAETFYDVSVVVIIYNCEEALCSTWLKSGQLTGGDAVQAHIQMVATSKGVGITRDNVAFRLPMQSFK